MLVNKAGIYATMDFPSYVFKEFPKKVTIGGQRFVVYNQLEEFKLLTDFNAPTPEPKIDQTDALRAQIAELEAQVARYAQGQVEAKPASSSVKANTPAPVLTLKDTPTP